MTNDQFFTILEKRINNNVTLSKFGSDTQWDRFRFALEADRVAAFCPLVSLRFIFRNVRMILLGTAAPNKAIISDDIKALAIIRTIVGDRRMPPPPGVPNNVHDRIRETIKVHQDNISAAIEADHPLATEERRRAMVAASDESKLRIKEHDDFMREMSRRKKEDERVAAMLNHMNAIRDAAGVKKKKAKPEDSMSKEMRRYTRRVKADLAAIKKNGGTDNQVVREQQEELERLRLRKSELTMFVCHKVRLSPNNVQKTYLKKCFGVARYCYNWSYDKWVEGRERGERLFASELRTQFVDQGRKGFPFTYDVTSNAKSTGFKAFAAAQESLFDGKGFPQRKKKGIGLGSLHYVIESDRKRPFISDVNLDHPDAVPSKKRQYLLVPGLGYVKMMEKIRFHGLPTSVAVKLESDGHYYAVIRIRIDKKEWRRTHKTQGFVLTEPIGIDLGLTTTATFSNGIKALAPKMSAKYEKRHKALKEQVQRDRAATRRNTKNKRRRAWQLAKSKAKQRRRRDDFLHKLTSVIATMFESVSVENLNITTMIKDGKSGSGNILKAAFYQFRLLLEQKMAFAEHHLHIADKGLPSTRTCSQCGCVGPKVPLRVRTFHCAECGAVIDRDLNAAINLARLVGLDEPEFKSFATDALEAALKRNGIETSKVAMESR